MKALLDLADWANGPGNDKLFAHGPIVGLAIFLLIDVWFCTLLVLMVKALDALVSLL